MCKVSVIIPVYNIEKYIGICLDSLLNQTFTDYEIICVNDGSKDASLDILNEYKERDNRIKVITKPNGGSGSARNRGLEDAQGKYVQFLDGDDYFEPEMLEKLYNLAELHKADIAVCSSRKVDDDGNITETQNPNFPIFLAVTPINKPFSYKDYPENIFDMIGTCPWNKLYLREMIIKNKLKFPSLTGPDDLCFVQMANICAERIVVINEELINYRFNRPGSVQTYRANHASDIVRASIYLKDFMIKNGIYDYLKKGYLSSYITSVRWEVSLCSNEQYEKFLNDLKELLPNSWEMFKPALRKDHITPKYLDNFIGSKTVMLWGASVFAQNLLNKEEEKNDKILGIVDKNEASWGKSIGHYKIYPPNSIKELKPDGIVVMVLSNHEKAYSIIKDEIEKNYSDVELLPDIFNE